MVAGNIHKRLQRGLLPRTAKWAKAVAAAAWSAACICWCAGWWVLLPQARAQTATQPPPTVAPEAHSPQRITVTGTAAQERRDAVQGKHVLSAEELARHGDTRLADALKRVPGVSVGGSGAELQIRLDGMAAEQTLVLLNGEPVPRGQVLETLAISQIERIEIVRGANVQWSGRGLAGTINIVTSRAARSVQRDASLALGSYFGHPTAQAELNLGDKNGARSWRVGLVGRVEREHYPQTMQLRFADASGSVVSAHRLHTTESNRDEALTLTPQLQWDHGEEARQGPRLQLQSVLSVSQFLGAGDDLRTDVQGSPPRMQSDRLYYRHRRSFGKLGFTGHWPLSADTRLAASISASRGRRVQDSLLTGSNFAGVAVRESAVDSTRVDDLLTARSDVQHTLGAAHTLTAGVQLDGNRRQENRLQREHIPSWEADLTDESYDAASHSLALFVQDDWLASKTTTVSLGARVERLKTTSTGNVFGGVQQTHQLASPMLNLLWRPHKNTQWKLGLSRAYRLPEPRDIMPRRWTRPENSSLIPDFVGNASLLPESAWTVAAGWEQQLGSESAGSFSANAVFKRVDDVILSELVLQDGQYLLRRANFGRAWVGSLQLQWQREVAAPWGGPVKLLLGAGVRRSRLNALAGPHNQLPGQAPWDARVEADHQPVGSAWTFTAAWRWRARVLSQGPSGRTLGESATHSGDLAALWQQNSANRWRFSVTGLGVPDTLETAVREWAGGTDSQQTTLQEAPRWRVQWMHRF